MFFNDINNDRFIPYIQLHEFEAFLFTNPNKLESKFFKSQNAIKELVKIVEKFKGNPELINDNPENSPSKRIIKLIPEYEHSKINVGATTAVMIGINELKKNCKHFADWINKLEKLSS